MTCPLRLIAHTIAMTARDRVEAPSPDCVQQKLMEVRR